MSAFRVYQFDDFNRHTYSLADETDRLVSFIFDLRMFEPNGKNVR